MHKLPKSYLKTKVNVATTFNWKSAIMDLGQFIKLATFKSSATSLPVGGAYSSNSSRNSVR